MISAKEAAILDVPHPLPNLQGCGSADLMGRIDIVRLDACRRLLQERRGEFGQFLTPAPVARFMASMFAAADPVITILDAGAGVGSLFAATVEQLCERVVPPREIRVTAYEIDPVLLEYLAETVDLCRLVCERSEVNFAAEIRSVDFLKDSADNLKGGLFAEPRDTFTLAIMNPPYRKISADSDARHYLRTIGIETSNLYTGFLATSVRLLARGGELVAITPRSFCNGTYFRTFRRAFLREMSLRRIHLFNSRQETFRDDRVLQETIIVHADKDAEARAHVTISSSSGPGDNLVLAHQLPYSGTVHPDDPEQFIRIVPDGICQQIVDRIGRFKATLADLGLSVSTGRVVDFRAKQYLMAVPLGDAAPLIYPLNIEEGGVVWPKRTRKMQYLGICEHTEWQFVPNENYVLVKRFTSKEQSRRIVSAVFEGGVLPGPRIGFENHLNYYHVNGRGLGIALAMGLSVYLNSTLVDAFFRQFNGHTQVNAGDLRSLRYPAIGELERLGRRYRGGYPDQGEIDGAMEEEFFGVTDAAGKNPIATEPRIGPLVKRGALTNA
jgi:adenine-specific DNA-methyltransferase